MKRIWLSNYCFLMCFHPFLSGILLTQFPVFIFLHLPSLSVEASPLAHWPWCRPRRWAGWRWSPRAPRWWFPASCRCPPTAWGPPGGWAGREPGGPSCWTRTGVTEVLLHSLHKFSLLNQLLQILVFRPRLSDLHSNGTHAGSASTVGDAEGLVQVKMRHVRAVVCWPAQSHLEGRREEIPIMVQQIWTDNQSNITNILCAYIFYLYVVPLCPLSADRHSDTGESVVQAAIGTISFCITVLLLNLDFFKWQFMKLFFNYCF